MSKPFALSTGTPDEPVLRCYDLEAGYAWQVQQDLISKAIEENS